MTVCFFIPGLFGAPYVPTLTKHAETALDLLDLQLGQTMLELGCGDGKVVLAAARRGWNVVGYELNPVLAAIVWVRTIRYRKHVHVVCGNFFKKPLPPADGIYCFIMPRFMPAVHKKILDSPHLHKSSLKLASFSFKIPGKTPDKIQDNVFIYTY